jgi:plasmid stabilization system protein ParE
MVGKIYRVVFTRYAQNRRREVYHFEERINGKRYAKKIQQLISEATQKLEKLPEIHPLYEYHDSTKEVRYTKALEYKILYHIRIETDEVVILTIRNDAEDPDRIAKEL